MKKGKIIGMALICLLSVSALICGGIFLHQYRDAQNSAAAFDHLVGLVVEVTSPAPDVSDAEGKEPSASAAELAQEKYGALFEQNNDFVGWISIDGTGIHYPVMQTPDNPDYYLKHGFDKSYSNYGVYGADDQIVQVALTQVGNVGGEPYWSWYGFGSRVEWCACFVSWCACFVSWCADQCGYIDTGVIPKFAGCVNGVQWFRDRDQWADNAIEPAPGMIIFFDWDDKGHSGDSCRVNQYPVGYYEILGYGIVNY